MLNVAGRQIVRRYTRSAQKLGVTEDMPLEVARAICPNAKVFDWNPREELRALFRAARWAIRFSPYVAIDDGALLCAQKKKFSLLSPLSTGIVLDISGTERLYPEKIRLLEALEKSFHRHGVALSFGLAPTYGASWALSRFSRSPFSSINSRAHIAQALSHYPVTALRIPAETIADLQELGIHFVGELLALPRKKLFSRFGKTLLARVDQTLGALDEPIRPVHEKECFSVEKNFEVPLEQHDRVSQAIFLTFSELALQLQRAQKKAGGFRLILHGLRPDYQVFSTCYEIPLQSGLISSPQILHILQAFIENKALPGRIITVRAEALLIERQQSIQENHLPDAMPLAQQQDIENLFNTLFVRLGKERVRALEFHESHIPERSYRLVSPTAPRQLRASPSSVPAHLNYPPHIFPRPETIRVLALLPDGAPVRIFWKGEELRIAQSIGPESIFSEWWGEEPPEERDYFKVHDTLGRWLWVFRERRSQEWFIHGIWV